MRGFCHQTLYAGLLMWRKGTWPLGHVGVGSIPNSFCEAHVSTYLSTYLSIYFFIYLHIGMILASMFLYLPIICLSIYLSIYLSFFLSRSIYVPATLQTKLTSPASQGKHIIINTVIHLLHQQWRLCPRVPLEHLARLLAHALHVMCFVQRS